MKKFLPLFILLISHHSWSTNLTLRSLNSHPLKIQSSPDCRSELKEKICLVQASEVPGEDRECENGGEGYLDIFEKLYDAYPPLLKNVFCSLDIIYIEKGFDGTAYAGSNPEATKVILGIRQSVLDEKMSLARWATWKEQLSFGGSPLDYSVRDDLPVVSSKPDFEINDFLYFLVAHEFGHILDFSLKLNDTLDCPEGSDANPDPECLMKPGSWGAISWENNKRPKPQNDFLNREGLCFYWCGNNPLYLLTVQPIYEALYHRTDFISLYSTTQPWDDFADSLAYVLTSENLGSTYVIDSCQGSALDMVAKLKSPLFKKKYEFIQKVLRK
jgi:hypothetical protein